MSLVNERLLAVSEVIKNPCFKVNVPCGSCHKCCSGFQMVRLLPGTDMPELYNTNVDSYGDLTLQHKPNGDCIYLEEGKCSIHNYKPAVCRAFDCRELHKAAKWDQLAITHPDLIELAEQGRVLREATCDNQCGQE